ncbi:MAG: type II 3-dehydroquinate dehydratase [Acutalibacteraceae bacterium]
MNILVINGPNLNMLGIREPDIYGKETYNSLVEKIENYGKSKNVGIRCYQSNHEGDLVDVIQSAYGLYDGIVINPGGYTHTSVAILDALKAVSIPAVEVHISDVDNREEFRKVSYVRSACFKTIGGKGTDGYLLAVDELIRKVTE